ncbi:hypothetical protein HPQ64_18215 [Rhizobiales bacterium]|uniref:hypothetical protein n=1 Tax=Hongsoonwoonella zoysiae TaxID=2821844 RepID=UPI0015601DFE|nr:hypothetical protein [Hongsoonwoonella zoysiae]NRG19630.1 hypothetical protein [Hongsoonwoonella zoysiae]
MAADPLRTLGAGPDLGHAAVVGEAARHIGFRGLSALGMPIAGLMWSAGTFLGRSGEIGGLDIPVAYAFAVVAVGGLSQTLAIWFGLSAVTWAMTRLFGAKAGFFQLLAVYSASAAPLWVAAPSAALYVSDEIALLGPILVVGCTGTALFFWKLSENLAAACGWTRLRASSALACTGVFLASFFSLYA